MGLTFDQEAKLIRENPDLSDGAILLLKLIIFRMYVTNLKDKKGRYVYLTGDGNDPRKVYGWARSKCDRTKRELRRERLYLRRSEGRIWQGIESLS